MNILNPFNACLEIDVPNQELHHGKKTLSCLLLQIPRKQIRQHWLKFFGGIVVPGKPFQPGSLP
jgi:hypothetical protein